MSLRSRIIRHTKRTITTVLSAPLRYQGFHPWAARTWTREVIRDWIQDTDIPVAEKLRRHRAGFLSNSSAGGSATDSSVSQRDYLYLYPFNGRPGWLRSRILAAKRVPGLADLMPTQYCTIHFDGPTFSMVRLSAYPDDLGSDLGGLIELLIRFGRLDLVPIRWNRGVGRSIEWSGQTFVVDGWPTDERGLLRVIKRMAGQSKVLVQAGLPRDPTDSVTRLYMQKGDDGAARVIEEFTLTGDSWLPGIPSLKDREEAYERGVRRGWTKRRRRRRFGDQRFENWDIGGAQLGERTNAFCESLENILGQPDAQFSFISMDFVPGVDPSSMALVDLASYPEYPAGGFSAPETNRHLHGAISEKELKKSEHSHVETQVMRLRRARRIEQRRLKSFMLRSKGYTGKMAASWVRREQRDLHREAFLIPRAQRKQALRQGFLPSTVARFGINASNRAEFISEREYSFAHALTRVFRGGVVLMGGLGVGKVR